MSAHLRPTTDRVRESLFNVLLGGRYGDLITGCRVLDLCAGTGALGLEALSRGAAHVTFVENGKTAQRLITRNIAKLKRERDCVLHTHDVTKLPAVQTPFDLIFLDPPYGKGLGAQALASASARGWVAPDALIVWEESAAQIAPLGFQTCDQRRYGDTWVTILRAKQ
jgi:16S rRNA (guanine966-N2)-methyltransferase